MTCSYIIFINCPGTVPHRKRIRRRRRRLFSRSVLIVISKTAIFRGKIRVRDEIQRSNDVPFDISLFYARVEPHSRQYDNRSSRLKKKPHL